MAFFDIKPAVGITVEAAEGYDQSYSGMQALIEGYQNDYALFTGALYQDIKEYSMVHEGASVGEIMALQEASISGFFDKIKEFFKKLWAKIKALFHRFIAKFDSMFMKSGKALAKKYRNEIEQKNMSECEVSFSKIKNSIVLTKTSISLGGIAKTISANSLTKSLEDFDQDEFACKQAAELVGNNFNPSSVSKLDEELHDHFFEDKDTVKWSEVETVVFDVLEKDEIVKNTKKTAETMDRSIANLIKEIDSAKSKLSKSYKDKNTHDSVTNSYTVDLKVKDKSGVSGSEDSFNYAGTSADGKDASGADAYRNKQAFLNLMSKQATATQVAINRISAGMIRAAKFHASQCRSALAKAVAYREPKNEAYIDTIADAIAYDPSIVL